MGRKQNLPTRVAFLSPLCTAIPERPVLSFLTRSPTNSKVGFHIFRSFRTGPSDVTPSHAPEWLALPSTACAGICSESIKHPDLRLPLAIVEEKRRRFVCVCLSSERVQSNPGNTGIVWNNALLESRTHPHDLALLEDLPVSHADTRTCDQCVLGDCRRFVRR
ncbi:hypothetical protein F4824DRAFT_481250 [Ustulina deusta]|nr:hypothetical protein F4824DRAFT_481250 [Ustulina deusta]